ncbi:lycopene cyclase domain-containing protein [Agromyces sp. G08B096]|uniref:Lycopene cyclase domain-containing protein n=1 Tax=Agromyces sp. G08B096 TaxID=3156399 RepID=A0AAU7W7I1_9MICO
MSLVYLALLVASIGCMVLLDLRFRLFFRVAPARAAITLAAGLAFLLAWDLVGIGLGIFLHTPNTISTGILLAPHLPLEEVVFLAFLCYLSMVLWTGALRIRAARAARAARVSAADRPRPTEGAAP